MDSSLQSARHPGDQKTSRLSLQSLSQQTGQKIDVDFSCKIVPAFSNYKLKTSVQRKQVSDREKKTEVLKSLISFNEPYYRNKLRYSEDDPKPNNIKFKIPTSTGQTSYKAEFVKKEKCYYNEKTKTDNFSPDSQNQSPRIPVKTRYGLDFPNWGTDLKPSPIIPQSSTPVLNIHFIATTRYQAEFTKKKPDQPFRHKKTSLPKLSNLTMNFESTYTSQFKPRQDLNKQIKSIKPTKTDVPFRGSSQYRDNYEAKLSFGGNSGKKRSLVEIQNLLLNA